jgi:hypothetical protein
MGCCTWSDGRGNWGVKGVDLSTLPPGAYGALYKLHEIEKAALEINTTRDPDLRAELHRELFQLCGGEVQ